jgi:hypothetical protein
MNSAVPLMQVMFLAQAGVQLLLLVWLYRIWRGTGLAVAAMLLVPQFGLFYDNFIVGIGSWVSKPFRGRASGFTGSWVRG